MALTIIKKIERKIINDLFSLIMSNINELIEYAKQRNEVVKIINNASKYPQPRRLTLLKTEGECDFCNDNKSTFTCYQLSYELHMGFAFCSKCEYDLELALEYYFETSGYNKIKHLIGKNINVQRTNGDIENDWMISETNKYVVDYSVFCQKINHDIGKYINIDKILELN